MDTLTEQYKTIKFIKKINHYKIQKTKICGIKI